MLLQFIMGLLAFKSLAQNWKKVELGDQIRLFFAIGSSLIAFRSLLVQEIKLQETPKDRG